MSCQNSNIIFQINKFLNYDQNKICKWVGHTNIGLLYMRYLSLANHQELSTDIFLDISKPFKNQMKITPIIATSIAQQIINSDKDVLVYELVLQKLENQYCHTNLLIYRRSKHVIEHFEPHGSSYLCDSYILNPTEPNTEKDDINNKIELYTLQFIDLINIHLTRNGINTVRYVIRNEVFDGIRGLQFKQCLSKSQYENESGYCLPWTLFMMEMIYIQPLIDTRDIIISVMEMSSMTSFKKSTFLLMLIRGFVHNIYDRLNEYFPFLFNCTCFSDENYSVYDDTIHNYIKILRRRFRGEKLGSALYLIQQQLSNQCIQLNLLSDRVFTL